MKFDFKLFNFMGSNVYIKLWVFILILFIPIIDFFNLFIAVLIHELAHVYVAKSLGYKTGSIVLDLFYGSAEIEIIKNHKSNILICLAGPISNLILSMLAFFIKLIIPNNLFFDSMIFINLILFIFNIIPIYPMDGGRISKSILSLGFGNFKGGYINGIVSILFSIGLVIMSFLSGSIILTLFGLLFIYISYKEIEKYRC